MQVLVSKSGGMSNSRIEILRRLAENDKEFSLPEGQQVQQAVRAKTCSARCFFQKSKPQNLRKPRQSACMAYNTSSWFESKMEVLHKLAWLLLGGDPADRSHSVEQFAALVPPESIAKLVERQLACELLPTVIGLCGHAVCFPCLRVWGKHEKVWF